MSKNNVKRYNSQQHYENNNVVEEEITVETPIEEVEAPVEETPVVEESVKETVVLGEPNKYASYNITYVEEVEQTETAREVCRVEENLSREEILKNRLKYLQNVINKSNNAVTKGIAYEKQKEFLAELKQIQNTNKTVTESKPVNYPKVSEHKEERESSYISRGQVMGQEGMFVRF